MNERFTLESTVIEITENDRVNKKLPIFFDLELCSQVKMALFKNEIKKYDEDDEVSGTGPGGCGKFYSGKAGSRR